MTEPAASGQGFDVEQAVVDLAQLVNDHDEQLGEHETAIARWNEATPEDWNETTPEDFVEWVEWLRTTYLLDSKLPNGWEQNPAVVAELKALQRAHRAAFSPKAGGFDPLTWHDGLARVIPRLVQWQTEYRRQNSRPIG